MHQRNNFSYGKIFMLFSIFMIIKWGYYPSVNQYLFGYSSAFYLKSYEFGFTKRGLIGTVFTSLFPYLTQAELAKIKFGFLVLFYFGISIVINKIAKEQKDEKIRWFLVLFLIALPSTYMFVYDDARLDIYFTAFFLISTGIIISDSFLCILPITVVNMILINETTCVTYLPTILSMLIYRLIRSTERNRKIKYLAIIMLISGFSIPLCIYFLLGSQNQGLWYSINIQKMLEHIREHCDFDFNLGALAAEASSLSKTVKISLGALNNSFSVTFIFLLSLIPAFYIFVCFWNGIRDKLKKITSYEKVALLFLALSPLSTIVYMLVAYDYGRYISFMFTAILCTLVFIIHTEHLQFDYNDMHLGNLEAIKASEFNIIPVIVIAFYLANGMFGAAPWVSDTVVRFDTFIQSVFSLF